MTSEGGIPRVWKTGAPKGGRVLYVATDLHPIPPVKGAAVEQWIDQVSRRLNRYEPYVVGPVHPSLPDDEIREGVRYKRIRIGGLYSLLRKATRLDTYGYISRVIRYGKSIRPDVIHVHNAPRFIYAIRDAFPKAKLILHMHNQGTLTGKLPIDSFVACSEFIKGWYISHGVEAPDFATIRNGVDVERFLPWWQRPGIREEVRGQYGVDARRLILYVGRIAREKGVDMLVDAFRMLDQTTYRLVLVGEWPKGDPRVRKRARFAQEVQSKVKGLAITSLGAIHPDEMHRVYYLGDILVVPSRSEGFSMAAIEAMASGVPVVGFGQGGLKEYLQDGVNARVLSAQSSSKDLADAIVSCLGDDRRNDQTVRSARRLVEKLYTWNHVVLETEDLYGRLLA